MDDGQRALGRNWVSDVELDRTSSSKPRTHLNCVRCFHCPSSIGHVGSRSTRNDFSPPKVFNEPKTSQPTGTEWWTSELTRTINCLSKECLDRLTRLESENNELRKQYQTLEAQISPLIKTMKAHERLRFLCRGRPENGKPVPYNGIYGWDHFHSQIKQLISILARTNVAQNDIREDCRYLKHRVSNLEEANSRLCSLVQQRYPECMHSCHSLSWIGLGAIQPPSELSTPGGAAKNTQLRNKPLEESEASRGSEELLPDSTSRRNKPCNPVNFKNVKSNGSGELTIDEKRALLRMLLSVPIYVSFSSAISHSMEEGRLTMREALEEKRSIPTCRLLNISSPSLQSSKRCLISLNTREHLHFPYIDQPDRKHTTPRLTGSLDSDIDLTSEIIERRNPKDSYGRLSSIFLNNNSSNRATHEIALLSGDCIQISSTSSRGPQQLPFRATGEPPGWKNDRPNSSVPAVSSEAATCQMIVNDVQLRMIGEVNSYGDTPCGKVTESQLGHSAAKASVDTLRAQSVSEKINANSHLEQWSPSMNQSILCRDPKQRYLHSLRSATDFFSPVTEGTLSRKQQSTDLETSIYEQEQMQKFRDARRNLRYCVFSDTELLTGKFTITSTDDSSGEAEDVLSSKESIRHGDRCNDRKSSVITCGEQPIAHSKEENANVGQDVPLLDHHLPNRFTLTTSAVPLAHPNEGPTLPVLLPTKEGCKSRRKSHRNAEATPCSSKNEIEYSMEDVSMLPKPEQDTARINAPPPVIIHRRRFGVLETNESSINRTFAKSNELNTPEFSSSSDLLNASSPAQYSNDDHTPDNTDDIQPSVSGSLTARKVEFLDQTHLSSAAVLFEIPLVHGALGGEPRQDPRAESLGELARIKAASVATAKSGNNDEPCLELYKKYTTVVSNENCKNVTKIPKATCEPTVFKSNLYLAREDIDTKQCNKNKAYSTPPGIRGPTPTQRPATSPRNRRTLGILNFTGKGPEMKPPDQRYFYSTQPHPTGSPPSSPASLTVLQNYRSHLHPSVVKPTKPSTSSTESLSQSSSKNESLLDNAINEEVVSPITLIREANTAIQSTSGACDDSSLESNLLKNTCNPPPIPPRTTSRTQGSSTKIVTVHLPVQGNCHPSRPTHAPVQTHIHATSVKCVALGPTLRSPSRGKQIGNNELPSSNLRSNKKKVTIVENGQHKLSTRTMQSGKQQVPIGQAVQYSRDRNWYSPNSSASACTTPFCEDRLSSMSLYVSSKACNDSAPSLSGQQNFPTGNVLVMSNHHLPIVPSQKSLYIKDLSTQFKKAPVCESRTVRSGLNGKQEGHTPSLLHKPKVTRCLSTGGRNPSLTQNSQPTIRYVPHSYKHG
ncbi:unnamed protein product [Dicrocoelium dendriticum]|nr:unnamed protein product [Dicrocoelium dendriticum]